MKHILKYFVVFLCCQCVLTSCSFSLERPTGVWENEDKSFVINFADGYNYDNMTCIIDTGEEKNEYDICFAVVESYISLGELSYSEFTEDSDNTTPVFCDEITFSYSYSKRKLVLKVVSSSNEFFVAGTEVVLNNTNTEDGSVCS